MRRRVQVVLDPEYRPWDPQAPPPVRLRRRRGGRWIIAAIVPPVVAAVIVAVVVVGRGGVRGGGDAGLPPATPAARAATPALRMTPGPGYKVVQCNEEILVVPISVDLNAVQCP
jgi:hypothetical protein